MTGERLSLRHEQETMLMTLHLHAADAASAHPILGDGFAGEVLDRVEHTPGRLSTIDGNLPVVCARARLIDDVTREFVGRHPDAVVLHLGCGLDSRVLRIDPGPGVAWFDVDQEPVIALRRRLYDERDGVTTIAASVTEPGWWADVPSGRPRLVVAEGLLMYLAPDGLSRVIGGVLDPTAARQVLVADTVASWTMWVSHRHPAMRAAGTGFESTTRDLLAATSGSGVALRAEASLPEAAGCWSTGAISAFVRLISVVPGVRRGMILQTFDSDPR